MNKIFFIFLFEMIGTAILMLMGVSGCANATLRKLPNNLECGYGYAFGVFVASVFADPVSGCHINPAVTIALFVIGKVKVQYIPAYLAGQYIGSFVGSTIAWTLYFESIKHFEVTGNLTNHAIESAKIFITVPAKEITIIPAVLDQVISTALLLFAILFIGDDSIFKSSKLLKMFTTSMVIFTFIVGFSFNCGAILNPARDLMPRILLYIVGYRHKVFEPLSYQFWWLVGIVSPHIGAIIGALIYYYLSRIRTELNLKETISQSKVGNVIAENGNNQIGGNKLTSYKSFSTTSPFPATSGQRRRSITPPSGQATRASTKQLDMSRFIPNNNNNI